MGYSTECIIESLEVEYSSGGLEDVIISVKGVLSGNYNGSHIHETGPLEFKVPAPDPSSYIAFASLTHSDVINFIKDTDQYISYMNTLTSIIDEKRQTATQGVCALPWE